MKKLVLPIFIALAHPVFSQGKDSYFIFDADWNPVKNLKKAKLFLRTVKINDTCWQWDYYNFSGPRIKTESFRDSAGEIPNGFFAYYSKNGYLDSCGYVANQRKDRNWTYLQGDNGKVYLQLTYDHGKLIKSEDYRNRPKVDEQQVTERTFNKVEIESEFPGGAKSWQKFLMSNLTYPKRAVDVEAQGEVWIVFIVEKDGKITEPILARSVEFSIDEEAMRMMKISPDWTPAIQGGEKVRSWKRQPIIFKLKK